MSERDSFEQMLPLERKPTEITIWLGKNMKRMDIAAFDRVRINRDSIEFDLDRQTYSVSLREELLWIDYPYNDSCQYDHVESNFRPGIYSSIETCPN